MLCNCAVQKFPIFAIHFCRPHFANINFCVLRSFFQKSACWPSCRRLALDRMCQKKWNMMKHVTSLITCLRPHQLWGPDLRSSPVCWQWWLWPKNYAVFDSSFMSRWQRRYLTYHPVFKWTYQGWQLTYWVRQPALWRVFWKMCNTGGVHNCLYDACDKHRRIPTQQNKL